MTLVLIAAMAVSFGTQDWIEAGVIAALVILNVTVGFTQEWKAEKTVAALESVGNLHNLIALLTFKIGRKSCRRCRTS